METLVERMLELMRRDPALALFDNPFPLKEAGLMTKDLPESWDFAVACRAYDEAKRIMREESQGELP